MRKRILALLLGASIFLTACTTTMSYTFNVETGDKVKVTLETEDGYTLKTSDGDIYVYDGDEKILAGFFLLPEAYTQMSGSGETQKICGYDWTVFQDTDGYWYGVAEVADSYTPILFSAKTQNGLKEILSQMSFESE